jgi:hypothetical protein
MAQRRDWTTLGRSDSMRVERPNAGEFGYRQRRTPRGRFIRQEPLMDQAGKRDHHTAAPGSDVVRSVRRESAEIDHAHATGKRANRGRKVSIDVTRDCERLWGRLLRWMIRDIARLEQHQLIGS